MHQESLFWLLWLCSSFLSCFDSLIQTALCSGFSSFFVFPLGKGEWGEDNPTFWPFVLFSLILEAVFCIVNNEAAQPVPLLLTQQISDGGCPAPRRVLAFLGGTVMPQTRFWGLVQVQRCGMLWRSGNGHGSICTLPTSLNKPGDHGLSSGRGKLCPQPSLGTQSNPLALRCPHSPRGSSASLVGLRFD